MRVVVASSIVLALLFSVAGCKRPKQGDPCRANDGPLCKDDSAALVCRAGAWEAIPCGGGCKGKGESLRCDPDEVVEGAPCLSGYPLDESMSSDWACGKDRKWLAKCVAGRWKRTETCACSMHWHEGITYHAQYVVCGPAEH